MRKGSTGNSTVCKSGRKELLVIAPNWLGDVVMATPFLSMLRDGYADDNITVLCRDYVSVLLERCPFIDRLIAYEKRKGVREAVRALKREGPGSGWDSAYVLPLSFSSALIAFLSGSTERIGFSGGVRSILLSARVQGGRSRTEHLSGIYIGLLGSRCNPDAVPYPSVVPPYNWESIIERVGIRDRYAVIAAGATYGPAKVWPPDKYASTANELYDQWRLQIVMVGSRGERSALDAIMEHSGIPYRNLAGECDVSDLSAVLRGASLVIGNDSGPVHISASMGIPTVAIFGSTSPKWTAPRGPRVGVVSASADCSPCFEKECPDGSYRCMTGIESSDVLNMAAEIMMEAAGEQRY